MCRDSPLTIIGHKDQTLRGEASSQTKMLKFPRDIVVDLSGAERILLYSCDSTKAEAENKRRRHSQPQFAPFSLHHKDRPKITDAKP